MILEGFSTNFEGFSKISTDFGRDFCQISGFGRMENVDVTIYSVVAVLDNFLKF